MIYRISARCSITDPLERRRRLAQLYRVFEVKKTAADSESLDSSTESTTADTQPTTKPLAGQGIIPLARPDEQTTEK